MNSNSIFEVLEDFWRGFEDPRSDRIYSSGNRGVKKRPGPRGSRNEEFLVPSLIDIMPSAESAETLKLFLVQNTCAMSQIWHLKGLIPSWTDETCLFKWGFCEKLVSQILHLKGLIPSWSDETCLFKWGFCEKLVSQILHLKGLIPSWTHKTCLFKRGFCEKLVSQILHSNGFFFSWTFMPF